MPIKKYKTIREAPHPGAVLDIEAVSSGMAGTVKLTRFELRLIDASGFHMTAVFTNGLKRGTVVSQQRLVANIRSICGRLNIGYYYGRRDI
jgi:hypothetical protein